MDPENDPWFAPTNIPLFAPIPPRPSDAEMLADILENWPTIRLGGGSIGASTTGVDGSAPTRPPIDLSALLPSSSGYAGLTPGSAGLGQGLDFGRAYPFNPLPSTDPSLSATAVAQSEGVIHPPPDNPPFGPPPPNLTNLNPGQRVNATAQQEAAARRRAAFSGISLEPAPVPASPQPSFAEFVRARPQPTLGGPLLRTPDGTALLPQTQNIGGYPYRPVGNAGVMVPVGPPAPWDHRTFLAPYDRNAALRAEQQNQAVRDVVQMEDSPLGGGAYAAANLAGADPWGQELALGLGASADGLLAAAAPSFAAAWAGDRRSASPLDSHARATYAPPEAEAAGGTYVLRNRQTGEVMRSGRSCDLCRRKDEHGRDPALLAFQFEPMHNTDDYDQQRGLEQFLHDEYTPPLNKIRPISPGNPNIDRYRAAALQYLGRSGSP